MKLLVVEDEKDLSESICEYMGKEQFICDPAYEYNTALEKIHLNEYSCIILDIMLPHQSGLQLLKILKKENKTDGVLIISAKDSLEDKITGLSIGADDYLAKPFHLAELKARVTAIIRRRSFDGKNLVELGRMTLDLSDRTLKGPENSPIPLTRKEYDLLLYFVSNKNRVITKDAIIEHLWIDGADMADNYDFVYSHVKNLRKKMVLAGCPDSIRVVYGMGYKFVIVE